MEGQTRQGRPTQPKARCADVTTNIKAAGHVAGGPVPRQSGCPSARHGTAISAPSIHGLSISYDTVTKQHGGTIKVDSKVGD